MNEEERTDVRKDICKKYEINVRETREGDKRFEI
jgi:hypothetical protein